MKKVALLAGLAIGLAACGQSTPAAQQSLNIAGAWTGTITYQDMNTPLNLQLVQTTGSDDFTGTAYNDNGSGTVSGKISTGVMNLTENNTNVGTFTGSFTATTYKGTVTSFGKTGTFSFTKNP